MYSIINTFVNTSLTLWPIKLSILLEFVHMSLATDGVTVASRGVNSNN